MISQQKKVLLITSDTPVFSREGEIHVFEPTLREIEEVSNLFSAVKWLTYLRPGFELNTRVVSDSRISMLPLPDSRGGKSIGKKLSVLFSLPSQWRSFVDQVAQADVIHTRGPSVPAMIGILYSFIDGKHVYWHKYAGDWNEKNSPFAYRLQRWLLKRLKKRNVRITINGTWAGLHRGFLPLENPCFNRELIERVTDQKHTLDYGSKLRICFVGSLEPFKGAVRLASALQVPEIAKQIEAIWFAGDGSDNDRLREIGRASLFPISVFGNISRKEIFVELYSKCHLMVLPSETEGFPKVVAEAAAHRCIPVVTDVSALDQYINDGVNGFLLANPSEEAIRSTFLEKILKHPDLKSVSEEAFKLAPLFTYERFRERIEKEILSIVP